MHGLSVDRCDATCPMTTTTMDSHTALQNSVQSPPQRQAQINPHPDDPSPAPPTIPEVTGNQSPPSDTTDIDTRAQKKRRAAEIRTLASASLLDLLLLADTRFSSQQDIWAHT